MATTLTFEQAGIEVLRVMAFKCGVTAGKSALLDALTPPWDETGIQQTKWNQVSFTVSRRDGS
jgi:hypothetical protein